MHTHTHTHNVIWSRGNHVAGDATFINQLVDFDKDNMSDKVLKKIGTYVNNPDFKPDLVGRVSGAAKSLCMWVRAMEVYGRIYRVVEPKRKVGFFSVFSLTVWEIHIYLLDFSV